MFEELIVVERTYKELLQTTLKEKKTRVGRLASFLTAGKGDLSGTSVENTGSPSCSSSGIPNSSLGAVTTVGFISCPSDDQLNEQIHFVDNVSGDRSPLESNM